MFDTYLRWPPPIVLPGEYVGGFACAPRDQLVLGCPESSVPCAQGQRLMGWAGQEIP